MVYFNDVCPNPKQWNSLIQQTEWKMYDEKTVSRMILNSLFIITAYDDDNIIGMLQVVGDSILNFYIQYLVVDSQWRRKGIASNMIDMALSKLKVIAHPDARIALFTTEKNKPFYEKHGFVARPNSNAGPAMILYVKDIPENCQSDRYN